VSYRDHVIQDLRLVLLRILVEAPGCEANSSILCAAVEDFGHKLSRDQIHTEIAWLAEQGLVTDRDLHTVKVVTLTGRGLDVAKGKAVVPGVKRPGPGA
jgi:hypothetical protein